ncbi:Ni/Fe-hydrogenase 2 integral membrane subunit HybB [Humidesulfovibrio mexicanus]|jgi:Ni/Fe-hydrogenase subunit HybB-like protein|uniref:Ni/Fe-hydrogenase 2 integral membrane subunit HybB n=1 Tax=Humidesulfovibrio mexicanus TaxID=147047 RepID=A0A239C3U2_9BACT|nr:Ni/Fe-hydrogenase cytochrome b subunit [Humidesulfovibrio mexicanus]SNS14800.1 Ni/Fe-hydrogenase 2 integral membrane subunit HybB [Humidesulfovibrio mexicanus]
MTIDKKTLMTPANIITGIILAVGLVITVLRFTKGIGAVTNLDQNNPWGLWIGFDLLCGVALAAGGYTTSAACYLFGMKKYHSAVRPAILTAFLGYALVVFALHYDVGRPYRLVYPIFVQPGTTSLLYEVGLCVFLYVTVLAIEFSPAALEWLGMKKLRNTVHKLTLALTVFGVVLSTLHQSSLGALYIAMPSKIHPLWYSPYLAVLFFVSSIPAGLSMVIFEGALAHKPWRHMMDKTHLDEHEGVILGFARGASIALAAYLCVKLVAVAYDDNWRYLATGWGAWWLVEVLGFVALPSLLYAIGSREKNITLIKWTAALTVFGIILNRFNVSMIAFNWQLPADQRYFPSFLEIMLSIFVVTVGVTVYRFIVSRMPIFFEHPEYKDAH